MRRISFIFLALILFSCGNEGISIEDVWIREVPEGIKVTALYMKINNYNKSKLNLIAIESDVSEYTEIHNTVTNDKGVSTMEKLENLEIPGGGSIKLMPMGIHVMLINLNKQIKQGDKVELNLIFEKSDQKKIFAEVRGFNDKEKMQMNH